MKFLRLYGVCIHTTGSSWRRPGRSRPSGGQIHRELGAIAHGDVLRTHPRSRHCRWARCSRCTCPCSTRARPGRWRLGAPQAPARPAPVRARSPGSPRRAGGGSARRVRSRRPGPTGRGGSRSGQGSSHAGFLESGRVDELDLGAGGGQGILFQGPTRPLPTKSPKTGTLRRAPRAAKNRPFQCRPAVASSPTERPRRRRARDLDALSDRALLGMRLCDLGCDLPGSELEAARPGCSPSSSGAGSRFGRTCGCRPSGSRPTACPGFAIPFYLAHPRLQELEQRQMGEVEGGDPRSFLQLMRHETGHALDSAYRAARARRTGARCSALRRAVPPALPAQAVQQALRAPPRDLATRRATRPRTSPRRWRSGSTRRRAGARATAAGRRSRSCATWTG